MPGSLFPIKFSIRHTLPPAISSRPLHGLQASKRAIQAIIRYHPVMHPTINQRPVYAVELELQSQAQEEIPIFGAAKLRIISEAANFPQGGAAKHA